MIIVSVITLFVIFFVSIALHEYSHGLVAYKLGDPTPKNFGRLTLNPLAHIDPFGTILLPLILILIPGILPFGYAKPVPINPRYFKNPKRGYMWVGLAGPAANFFLAFILSILLKMVPFSLFSEIMLWGVIANLILAIFNLIPIPPLDGSRVLASILPYHLSYGFLKLQFYGLIAIVFLINLGLFRWLIIPAVKAVFFIFGIGSYYPF
jgi:Zn-dependent protease